jgi:hypothetical protein
MRCPSCACEIAEQAVLSEAGRIAVRRRRTHKGATPKLYPCYWCRAACTGRAGLLAHERQCPHRKSWRPVEDADFIAVDLEDLARLQG